MLLSALSPVCQGKIALRLQLTIRYWLRQQRFGRLLKNLKSAEPNGISDEKSPRPKTISKRAAPSKQNGTAVKGKAYAMHVDGEDDDDHEAERKLADDEETPSKKCKTGKQNSTPKWNSVFEHNDDVITIEDDEKNEDDAATIKAEGELDWEDVI